ncbi:MAG: ATP-binding cassette domain-containing protein [Bdellovibrionaceae bacterium]|nr:ATP-binding cassette domain-containing protein [Pseudobdellovibrionaceae bacterium]
MIELKNLSVRFDDQDVLTNIALAIHPGESFGLVGPSGQGKTLILKLIAGLVEPTSGEVLIEGKTWGQRTESEKLVLLKKMGMLFQKNALFDSLTCLENIGFALQENTTKTEKEIVEIGEYYLNAVGISHARNLYPDEISGGMQKRLGIARALALEPQIVLYDDPTAGLDPITSKKIIDLIADLKKKNNATIVVISNDMNRTYQISDKIGMVYNAGLILTGSVDETKKYPHPAVQQFIKGDVEGPLTNRRPVEEL